jgi:hypothetical protein
MKPLENKMETITLIELFQPQVLADAEAARVEAEQALRNVTTETADERAKMTEQYQKLRAEIPALQQKLRPLQECIRMKAQTGLDDTADKAQLAEAEKLIARMQAEFKELEDKFRPQENRAKELIAQATAALAKAGEAADQARARIGKAIAAHEAHQADPQTGLGPIPKFPTLKEAVRHFYPIGFALTDEGAAYQAFLGDLVWPYVHNGKIDGMIPESLSWLGDFESFKALPCPRHRTYILESKLLHEALFERQVGPIVDRQIRRTSDRKILCFVEETGEILASHTAVHIAMPGKPRAENFSDLFGSWEEAVAPALKDMAAHGRLDLEAQGDVPMLGELIREAWKIAAPKVSSKKVFQWGQGRLSEAKINELVGAYWQAFIRSPWEPSIEGTYALLKHRCARGEIPNVYSFEVPGHFGFRVRTPDHDWIIGEIYCPPDHFTPGEAPDPTKLTNLDPDGDGWLAELGPVKFYIRKTPSRT